MAQYKDVELSTGLTVRVYRSPLRKIQAMVLEKDPMPLPPLVSEQVRSGRVETIANPSDPDYLQALKEWREREPARKEQIDILEGLSMLRDLKVPDDWDVEQVAGDIARFHDPDWKPREGPMGRKADYLQWEVLGDPIDAYRVEIARAELSGIDEEEVRANQASFRDNSEGEADQ